MRTTPAQETFDVLIVGAGLSGIGAGATCGARCPAQTFAILEARDAIGGTWDLFRYPGIRSDSDMHTLGYAFSPWKDAAGDRRRPLDPQLRPRRPPTSYGITERVRFGHRVHARRLVDRATRAGRSRSSAPTRRAR